MSQIEEGECVKILKKVDTLLDSQVIIKNKFSSIADL